MEQKGKHSKKYAVAISGAKSVVRILVYILIVLFIIYLGKTGYGLGYEVFNQKQADEPADAKYISVTITEDMSVYQIGEMLKEEGLVEKPMVFWMQEKVSDYRGKLEPGTYEVTTAQTIDEMLATMSHAEVEEEDGES